MTIVKGSVLPYDFWTPPSYHAVQCTMYIVHDPDFSNQHYLIDIVLGFCKVQIISGPSASARAGLGARKLPYLASPMNVFYPPLQSSMTWRYQGEFSADPTSP